MKNQSHIIIFFILLLAAITIACRPAKPVTTSEPVKRTYTPFSVKPSDAIAIKPQHDSSLVFYFDRFEWNKCVATKDSTGKAAGIYMNLLDSLEKANGTISFSQLKWTVSEKWQLNPGKTTQDIFDSLVNTGHTYIVYPDGKHVSSIVTYSSPGFNGETICFDDAETNRRLYYIARANPGQF